MTCALSRWQRRFHVGSEPTGIAANSKKNEIYVVNPGSNNISVIDAETNTVVATIGVHGRPYFIDVAEDGKRAYVANSGSSNVSVIDLEKTHRHCERPRRRLAGTGAGFARRLDGRG